MALNCLTKFVYLNAVEHRAGKNMQPSATCTELCLRPPSAVLVACLCRLGLFAFPHVHIEHGMCREF